MKKVWIDYFAKIAKETAAMSYANRLKVGCVIVKENAQGHYNIISIGYNGMPSGWENVCEDTIDTGTNIYYQTKPEVMHAERNALDKVTRSTESSEGAVAFTTTEPCLECAKSLFAAGIKEVYYIDAYDRVPNVGINFLEKSGVKVCQI
jgi:dCMP deaminase